MFTKKHDAAQSQGPRATPALQTSTFPLFLLDLDKPQSRSFFQHGIPHSKLNKQQLVERLQAAGIAFITENSASSDHPTSTAKTTPLKRASKKNKQTTPTLQDPINPIASDVTPTQPIVAPLIEAIDSVEGSRETTTISAPSTKPPTSAPSVAVQNGISGPSRPAIKSATPKKPLIPHQTARKRAEPYANNAPKIINKRVKVQLKPSSNPLQTVKPVERLQAQEAVLVSNTEYIRSHFVERLYRWADSGRREPQNRQPAFTGLDALLQEPALTFLSASRFFIARLHTLLQLGTFDLVTSVVNCTLVAGDIWHIKLSDDSTFHFIGATGEVVGSPDLRSDWQAYLASPSPLIKHVQTKGGVLFRVGVDVALAERIILTSCALNR